MMPQIGRKTVEEKVAQMNRKSYNRFQWWRRYSPRPELDEKMPLSMRVAHGDFETSDYYYQAAHEVYLMEDAISTMLQPDEIHEKRSLYMERFRRLMEDYEKEEKNILHVFKRDMRKAFNVSKEQLDAEMEEFDGTMQELYFYIKEKYSK
jgi:hypothetical protein